MLDIKQNFSAAEIACRCGHSQCERTESAIADSPTLGLAPATADMLAAIRQEYGKPLIITSAHRCKHHLIARKKKRMGAHQQGTAIDIAMPSNTKDRHRLLTIIFKNAPEGIGIAADFVHIDTGHKYAMRPALWHY